MKEKDIERAIQSFIGSRGHWVENLQSGKVLVKKWWYSNYMHLCTAGTPDLVALMNGKFVWIEVKKNKEEYDRWLKMEKRYRWEWKPPPISAHREVAQIEHKDKILANGGDFYLIYSFDQFYNIYKDNYAKEV